MFFSVDRFIRKVNQQTHPPPSIANGDFFIATPSSTDEFAKNQLFYPDPPDFCPVPKEPRTDQRRRGSNGEDGTYLLHRAISPAERKGDY